MIGNNLKRDIVGANRMGITSILASYSPGIIWCLNVKRKYQIML